MLHIAALYIRTGDDFIVGFDKLFVQDLVYLCHQLRGCYFLNHFKIHACGAGWALAKFLLLIFQLQL